MSKFATVREHETAAPNYDLTTDDIIAKLEEWDAAFGVTVSDVGDDRLMVHFDRLPENLDVLANEITTFCSDVVCQGFDCFLEMLEQPDDLDPRMVADMRELADGVDFSDPEFGSVLLKRSLRRDRAIGLWWD